MKIVSRGYLEQHRNRIAIILFLGLLWPSIIINKALEFIILVGFSLLILYFNRFQFDIVSKGGGLFALVGIVSWIYAVFDRPATAERMIAAIIINIIWFIGVVIYELSRGSRISIMNLSSMFFFNYMVWIISAIVFLIFVKFDVEASIYHYEYGRARFIGLFEYPTLNVPFALMHAPLASVFIWGKTKSKMLTCICYMLQWIPIYYSYSRSGYVLVLLQMIAFICYFICKELKKRKWLKKGISLSSIFLFLLSPVMGYIVIKLFQKLLGIREGSNNSRMTIYLETIEKIIEHPLIGNGIKTPTSIGLPLGSHCTYLGFVYRTGLIGGGIILFTILVAIILIWKKRKLDNVLWFSSFCTVVLLLMFAFLEDLDGEYWLLCMFFFYIGILQNEDVFKI